MIRAAQVTATVHSFLFVSIVAILLAAAAAGSQSHSPSISPSLGGLLLDDEAVRCRMCSFAVKDMWQEGEKIRARCHAEPARIDDECLHSLLQPQAIRGVVAATCARLPRTHTAIVENSATLHFVERTSEIASSENRGEIDEGERDDEQNEDSQIVTDHLEDVCRRSLHTDSDLDRMSRLLHANLDSKKRAADILYPLQKKFCRTVCGHAKPPTRKSRPMHTRNGEHNEDFTRAIAMENERVDEATRSAALERVRDAAVSASRRAHRDEL